MDDRKRFVEELLDAALKRYGAEAPRPGLEARILANVWASERAARRRRWIWALAATGVAVAAGALLLYGPRRRPVPVPSLPQASVSMPDAGLTTAPRTISVRPEMARHIRRATAHLSRPAQFPTPAPLSEEERLLLAYVSHTPRSELITPIIRDPKIDPLEIPRLKLARIEIKELPK